MKFSYSYGSNDNISESFMLHEIEILSWNLTPLLVNLVYSRGQLFAMTLFKFTNESWSYKNKFLIINLKKILRVKILNFSSSAYGFSTQ